MRFFTIAFAAALCLGAFVQATPRRLIKRGAGQETATNGEVIDQSYTHSPKQDAQLAGHSSEGPIGSGRCAGGCPVGPSEPTDCVGIIQSLLRELFPTLDFAAHEVDAIAAHIFHILGADDVSYAFLHGRIGLLNDLLALLGCTIDTLILTIEGVVTGVL